MTTTVRPGALTELLAELARAPEGGAGWDVPLLPGDAVGRFEVVREIGRGGFGVVYEARDRELSRSVAFKAVRAMAGDPLREARRLGEAEAAARLAHPNIVHLYDVGRCEQGPYLIMELLRGETLAERLARGKLPLREAVRIGVEIARGLSHAHAQGVVHRDLKPGNVFLCEDGQVKVLDFGLAHVFGRAGIAGGTPAYMAPEQERGEVGDERADVFSLGVMLRELITGNRPKPHGSSVPADAGQGLAPRAQDEAAGSSVPGVTPQLLRSPPALTKLTARMLSEDPALRPPNGQEVCAALAAIQKSLEPRWRFWAAWSVAAVALVAALGFALRSRPLPPGRLLVAMADTENATGEPDLDGVSELLAMGLEQSRRVSLMSRSRLVNVLREAGRAIPRVIGEAEARSAARKAQAQVLVVPAVRQTGTGYEVAVRAVDLARNEPLFALREAAGAKGSLADVADRLSDGVRRELHEDPREAAEPRARIADATSANPEAWRHYVDWQRLWSEGRYDDARSALGRALEVDPEFPLALVHRALGAAEGGEADLEKARRHAATALANVHRVPAKERALVEAMTGMLFDGTQSERLRLLDHVIANWPEDPWAYLWAGNVLLHHHADLAAARPYLEKALVITPLSPGDAIMFLVALGRFDEALAGGRRWSEQTPNGVSLAWLSSVHRWRGEEREALEAARRSLSFGRRPPTSDLRWAFVAADALEELEAVLRGTAEERSPHWLALRGRWRDALVALDGQAPPAGAAAAARAWFHGLRADLLTHRGGDPDAVWRDVEEQFRNGGSLYQCNAWGLALLGDLERAKRLVEGWVSVDHAGCARMWRFVDRWKSGDREPALRGLEGVFGYASAFYRGEILAELGRHGEAVELFQRYRRMPDFPWGEEFYNPFMTAANYARSLHLEAVSLERMGEPAKALQLLDRLLRLWTGADADTRHLREAKALRARLAAARDGNPGAWR